MGKYPVIDQDEFRLTSTQREEFIHEREKAKAILLTECRRLNWNSTYKLPDSCPDLLNWVF
jgi:hypothetical protein